MDGWAAVALWERWKAAQPEAALQGPRAGRGIRAVTKVDGKLSMPLKSERNRLCVEIGTDKGDPKKFLERIRKVNKNEPFSAKLLLNQDM